MSVPPIVTELVERFTQHGDEYRTGRFNETQLRRDFLDPLFEALGWDVSNKAGYAEAYRDVIHEDAIKVGGATKAPDYCFRVGGTRKFFVEAKKPGVDLKNDPLPAYQLRRYGWSAKLPLCILTDFEEFAVYDCRKRPDAGDKASVARTMYLKYIDFADRWDDVAGIFSREAVLKGSFDKYADSSKRKRGTAEVDDAFLAEIEGWRELLARNIALRNSGLGVRDLNYAVQKTIDRLVFLRICEDRGIEDYGRLQALQNGQKVYARLTQLFEAADDRYNSGLFHFHKEKNRVEPPDEWTLSLAIDDKPLKEIIRHLYYPDSPYEFSVLPADILGQVYERFLGKVIRLTTGGSAKVEEKPEVRKAGGVYYTPTYIVDYIVENTVGKLLDGAKVVQVERRDRRLDRTLRVLDPACGSGSFLLGAYQYLLDWHLKWYVEHEPEKLAATASPPIHFDAKLKDWRLTTAERKRILLDHIYGVDIDAQAVEVTKLSLLLKVLEGETRDTLQKQLFAKERALPDLAENIKCGNSLIGSDFYRDKQLDLYDDDEQLRINAFDWEIEFAGIISGGGFDAVIGNPPYINMLILDKTLPDGVKAYWKKKYHSAAGAFDIYVIFLEQAQRVAVLNAILGFIIPNKFMAAEYAMSFRSWIQDNLTMLRLVDYSRINIWRASVYPVVPIFENTCPLAADHAVVYRATDTSKDGLELVNSIETEALRVVPDNLWSFITQNGSHVLLKVLKNSDALDVCADVSGSCTVSEGSDYPRSLHELQAFKEKESIFEKHAKFVVSGSVFRYHTNWNDQPVRYMRTTYDRPLLAKASPVPDRRIKQAESPKLVICKVALEPRAFVDSEGEYAGGYTTYVFTDTQDLHFLCAIINSSVSKFAFRLLYDALAMAGGYLRFQPPQVRRMPIPKYASPMQRNALRDRAITMKSLFEKLNSVNTAHQKVVLQRQLETTDREIDALVYELYGLTDAEIAIVEAATG